MTWTTDELSRIGAAEELQIAPYRADGTLRPWVIVWVVRSDDELYVRSAYRKAGGWFQRAEETGRGRIRVGGLEKDVVFATAADDAHDGIDAAYHTKYDRYGPKIVGTVVGEAVRDVTLRLAAD